MKRICVFCGSSPGADEAFAAMARGLGGLLASRGLGLVFGGSELGLMGAVADGALEEGGEVIGVLPRALDQREVAHRRLPDLRIVGSMHERKAMMEDLSDGFIALPGGLGTLDELFEILTWSQLGIHRKPCAVLNMNGFFDPLLAYLDSAVEARFVNPLHRDILLVDTDAGALVDRMMRFEPAPVDKWMDRPRA